MAGVREATAADRLAIVRMAREFHAVANMPIAFDTAYAAAMAASYIADKDKLCLVMDGESGAVGVLAAHIYRHQLAPVMAADELIWWIDPAHRGRSSLAMLDAYEEWARCKDCAIVGMSTPPSDDKAAAIYRRRGYSAVGAHFLKTI